MTGVNIIFIASSASIAFLGVLAPLLIGAIEGRRATLRIRQDIPLRDMWKFCWAGAFIVSIVSLGLFAVSMSILDGSTPFGASTGENQNSFLGIMLLKILLGAGMILTPKYIATLPTLFFGLAIGGFIAKRHLEAGE